MQAVIRGCGTGKKGNGPKEAAGGIGLRGWVGLWVGSSEPDRLGWYIYIWVINPFSIHSHTLFLFHLLTELHALFSVPILSSLNFFSKHNFKIPKSKKFFLETRKNYLLFCSDSIWIRMVVVLWLRWRGLRQVRWCRRCLILIVMLRLIAWIGFVLLPSVPGFEDWCWFQWCVELVPRSQLCVGYDSMIYGLVYGFDFETVTWVCYNLWGFGRMCVCVNWWLVCVETAWGFWYRFINCEKIVLLMSLFFCGLGNFVRFKIAGLMNFCRWNSLVSLGIFGLCVLSFCGFVGFDWNGLQVLGVENRPP